MLVEDGHSSGVEGRRSRSSVEIRQSVRCWDVSSAAIVCDLVADLVEVLEEASRGTVVRAIVAVLGCTQELRPWM